MSSLAAILACATPVETNFECQDDAVFQDGTVQQNQFYAQECADYLKELYSESFDVVANSSGAYQVMRGYQYRIPASVAAETLPEYSPFYLERRSTDLFDVVAEQIYFNDQATLDDYQAVQGNTNRYRFLVALAEDSITAILTSEGGIHLQEFLADPTVSQSWTRDDFVGARESLMQIDHIINDLYVLRYPHFTHTAAEDAAEYDRPKSVSLQIIKDLSPENQELILSVRRCLDNNYPNQYDTECDPNLDEAQQKEHDWLLHVMRCCAGYNSLDEYLTQISQS